MYQKKKIIKHEKLGKINQILNEIKVKTKQRKLCYIKFNRAK